MARICVKEYTRKDGVKIDAHCYEARRRAIRQSAQRGPKFRKTKAETDPNRTARATERKRRAQKFVASRDLARRARQLNEQNDRRREIKRLFKSLK